MRTCRLWSVVSVLTLILTATLGSQSEIDPRNPNAAKTIFDQSDPQSTTQVSSTELGRDIEPDLKALLPIGWSINHGPNSLILSRDEPVFIYSPIQWPVAIEKSMDEMVRKYGEEIVYRVTLRFIPRLTQAEYAALKREWKRCHVENKPGRTFSIEKWERSQECYRAKQPPVYYNKRYSVYVERPDWWSALHIYPQKAANECSSVHASIAKILRPYESVRPRRACLGPHDGDGFLKYINHNNKAPAPLSQARPTKPKPISDAARTRQTSMTAQRTPCRHRSPPTG